MAMSASTMISSSSEGPDGCKGSMWLLVERVVEIVKIPSRPWWPLPGRKGEMTGNKDSMVVVVMMRKWPGIGRPAVGIHVVSLHP